MYVHLLYPFLCQWTFRFLPCPAGLSRWLSGKESTCKAGGVDLISPSLGWEDPLEKQMATHSSRTFAWEISSTEEPGGLQSMGSQESDTAWWLNNNVLTIVNNAAVNSWGFWIMVFCRYMPRSRIIESYGSYSFSFLRNLHTVLHSGYNQCTFPPIVKEGSLFLHPLSSIYFCRLCY